MPDVLFDAKAIADVVRVPARAVVAIEGRGEPGGPAFQDAIGAVYGVAYTLKFTRKPSGDDFRIGPLEARWWTDDPKRSINEVPRSEWRWRLRLAVPRDVKGVDVSRAIHAATTKRGGKLEGSAAAVRVALEHVGAARMGRVLHVGSYGDEAASFAKILAAVEAAGLAPRHAHLEVYLSDPRRTSPAKLRTVLLLELED
jgi:hypothetical protein